MKSLIMSLILSLMALPAVAAPVQKHSMDVTSKGFEPSEITVKANEPLELKVTRKTDKTCAKKLAVPEYKIEQELPLNKPVVVKLTPSKAGKVVFGCAMDQMVKGVFVVQ